MLPHSLSESYPAPSVSTKSYWSFTSESQHSNNLRLTLQHESTPVRPLCWINLTFDFSLQQCRPLQIFRSLFTNKTDVSPESTRCLCRVWSYLPISLSLSSFFCHSPTKVSMPSTRKTFKSLFCQIYNFMFILWSPFDKESYRNEHASIRSRPMQFPMFLIICLPNDWFAFQFWSNTHFGCSLWEQKRKTFSGFWMVTSFLLRK